MPTNKRLMAMQPSHESRRLLLRSGRLHDLRSALGDAGDRDPRRRLVGARRGAAVAWRANLGVQAPPHYNGPPWLFAWVDHVHAARQGLRASAAHDMAAIVEARSE